MNIIQLKKLIMTEVKKNMLSESVDRDYFREPMNLGEVTDGYAVIQNLAIEINVNPQNIFSQVMAKYHYPAESEPIESIIVRSRNFCDSVEAVVEDMGLEPDSDIMKVFRNTLKDYEFVCI